MDLFTIEQLTQELNSLTGWLLIASLKSVPLIAAILLVQYGFKKNISANARYSLWLSLLLCLTIPFGWNISLEGNTNTLLIHSEAVATTDQKITPTPEKFSTHTTQATPIADIELTTTASSTLNFHTLLSYIWLGVFLSLSSITLWQLQRFNRIRKTATPSNPQQEKLLESSKLSLGIDKKIPLLYSEKVHSPLTFGLLKPVIILPATIEQQLTPTQIQHVLLHELAHIQRRDILWNWLAYWIVLFHWFNPLAWYASKRMKADMEMACDAKVLTHLSQETRNDYGLTLINVSQLSLKPSRLNCSLGILENHRELKNRLIMIKEFTTMTLKKSILFGVVFSAFAFTALAQPNQQKITSAEKPLAETGITLQQFSEKVEQDLNTKILIGVNSNERIQANFADTPMSYEQLLAQLQINGYTAFKTKDYIQIVSVRDARTLAPIAAAGKTYFDDEFITDHIKLEKACAESVLAAVRPLVPSYGFLSTYGDAKTLIIVDAYSNVQRVKNVVATIENNLDAPSICDASNIATNKPASVKK